jgi:hypothetical protein
VESGPNSLRRYYDPILLSRANGYPAFPPSDLITYTFGGVGNNWGKWQRDVVPAGLDAYRPRGGGRRWQQDIIAVLVKGALDPVECDGCNRWSEDAQGIG